MLQALRKEACERPSAKSLLEHPWMQHHASTRQSIDAKPVQDPLGLPNLNSPWIQTFISPNQSLSPRMGSWKISAQQVQDLTGELHEHLLQTPAFCGVAILLQACFANNYSCTHFSQKPQTIDHLQPHIFPLVSDGVADPTVSLQQLWL